MSMKFYTAHKGMFSMAAHSDVFIVDPKEKLQPNEKESVGDGIYTGPVSFETDIVSMPHPKNSPNILTILGLGKEEK